MIHIQVTGAAELAARLERVIPEARSRIQGGALRTAANAIAEEGNRRVHSPQGHARTFKVYVDHGVGKVTPGSRANFFSQQFMPILNATVNATHSRVENVIRDAVEAAVRAVVR